MVDQDEHVLIGRVRAREIPGLAILGARTMDELALTARLERVRATFPPSPLRLPMLTLLRLFNLSLLPSWVCHTAGDAATVTAFPLGGTRHLRIRLAIVARVLAVLTAAVAAIAAVMVIWPAAALPICAVCVVVFVASYAPFLGLLPSVWRDRKANEALREARAEVVAATPGLVLWASDLAGGGDGAGKVLAQRLLAVADAEGITIVAFIEEGLVRYYRHQGFDCQAPVPTSWGAQRLAVRPPATPTRPACGDGLSLPKSWRRAAPRSESGPPIDA